MTQNEIRIMNLSVDIQSARDIMAIESSQGKRGISIGAFLMYCLPRIEHRAEKLELMRKCASLRDIWNISELSTQLKVTRQTLYNWKNQGLLILNNDGKVILPLTVSLWDDLSQVIAL